MNVKFNFVDLDIMDEIFNATCTTSYISNILVVHVPVRSDESMSNLKYLILDFLSIAGNYNLKVINYDTSDIGVLIYLTEND